MRIVELFETKSNLKTLYVSRQLLNAEDIVKWAKEQGFTKCLPNDDFHVTVAFSKKPIDYTDITDSWDTVISKINKTHPEKTKREMKAFGKDGNAIVLAFKCDDLHTRWEEFRDDFGASWDFDGYHPHVTITYEGLPEGLKLEDIEPYQGELKFGPEIVDEVNDNWKGGVKEKKLTEQFLYETPEQVETKPFKEWFKNSKVVGPDGKPIVVYHGTGSNFKAFNMKKQVMGIIWFTSNKADIEAGEVGAQGSGKILELYASIQNPADWKAYDQLGLGELIGRGYDGAILPDRDGHFTGFVFQPSQLKSATKNRGNFDRHQNSLYEKMVHLDSREHDGYDVAIDPTRQEWNKYFAKYGAAGVFLKSGSIVVGDGEALDHLFLLRMASVDYSQELYRLQLYPDKVVIEMWDELGDIEHEPSPEEIESLTKFPKTIRQKAALTVKPVVARFMGNVPVIVELKSGISGDNWLEEQY